MVQKQSEKRIQLMKTIYTMQLKIGEGGWGVTMFFIKNYQFVEAKKRSMFGY